MLSHCSCCSWTDLPLQDSKLNLRDMIQLLQEEVQHLKCIIEKGSQQPCSLNFRHSKKKKLDVKVWQSPGIKHHAEKATCFPNSGREASFKKIAYPMFRKESHFSVLFKFYSKKKFVKSEWSDGIVRETLVDGSQHVEFNDSSQVLNLRDLFKGGHAKLTLKK